MNREKVKSAFRKALKALKIFIICSIILTVMELGIGFWLLKTRWQLYISKQQMREFAQELTDSEPLPENFLRVYKTIAPNHIDASMTEMLFFNYAVRLIFRDHDYDSKPHCYCDLIYDIQVKHNEKLRDVNWTGRVVDLEYGFGLEKYTTPDKCFTYFMNEHVAQLVKKLNPNQYPNISRDRIATMTDDEIIELMLLLKSHDRFNKFRNPELVEKYHNDYKRILEKAALDTQ